MSYGSSITKRAYHLAPYWIKSLISSSYGMSQRIQRYGKLYKEHIEFLEESQYWTNEKLADYQQWKLSKFFNDINKKVPYYNIQPYLDYIHSASKYQKLPILTKEHVRQNNNDLYNSNLNKVKWSHTSGTTGSSMIFPLSLEAFQKEYAFRYLHYDWCNVNLHNREKVAMCAGHPVTPSNRNKPPFWVYDFANNHLYFSSYHLSEYNMRSYIRKLEDFNPHLLHGYPSSIYILARAYKKYKKKKLNLKSIVTSSETLLDFQREMIENAFQVKAYNYYGTSEMSANILECEKGELHLKAEYSYVEILNENNNLCKPGETGRIVSTNFNNLAFPLIRYDIGDVVRISSNQNSKCGRSGLLIDYIEGRIENYIYTPDGRVIGRLDHLFKDAINVKEAQIEQRDINEVIIRIVREKAYSQQDEKAIQNEARIRLGNSIKLVFDYVEQIPRTRNGKFQFIITKIDRLEIANKLNNNLT